MYQDHWGPKLARGAVNQTSKEAKKTFTVWLFLREWGEAKKLFSIPSTRGLCPLQEDSRAILGRQTKNNILHIRVNALFKVWHQR